MLRIILGFFGYVKVPTEAVQISVTNEMLLETAEQVEEDEQLAAMWKKMLDGQRSLTEFLRSGKRLSG